MMAGPIDPRLLRRASATRGFLVAGVAVGSATAILTLGQAWLLSFSVAGIFYKGQYDGLIVVAWALAAIFAGKALLNWLHQWIAHRTSAAVKSQLRRDIIGARLAHPIDSPTTTGGLITLVTQGLDALDGYFSKYLPQLMLSVTVPVIIAVAILTSDFWSAVIVAVTLPLIPVFMALVGWTTEARTRKRWAIQTRLAHHFADLVTGLPTLQVFGRAKAQARGLKLTEAAHVRETMATLRISFMSAMVLELLSTLSVALVAVTVGFRVAFGDLDLGTALFVLILAPEAYLPIRQVGVHYHDSADGVAAAEAAFGLIDAHEPTEETTRPTIGMLFRKNRGTEANAESEVSSAVSPTVIPGTPLLRVRGLSHTYPETDHPALAPIDFDLASGEVIAIAGGSGGGKTTMLNALLGFLTPTEGEILVNGAPVSDWDAWRHQLAYVGQFPGLVNGDIGTNVRLGTPDATDAEVRAALDAAGAPGLSLTHSVGDNAEGVSAGERRRIATARALLRITSDRNQGLPAAQLMILDEPTAGLDAASEETLLTSLRAAGVAALVVSHRPAVLAMADRVIRIEAPDAEQGQDAVASEPTSDEPTPTKAEVQADIAEARDESAPTTPEASSDDVADLADADGERSLMNRLLDAVPNSRRWLILSVLLAFAATAATVALMGVSAWLLAFAALMVGASFLQAPSVLVRFFAISRGVFRYSERLAGHNVALRLQSALRLETYNRLARTTLLGQRRGDLLTRVVADVEAVQDLIVRVWIPFTASTLVILLTSAALGVVSPATGLVVLLSAVAAGLLLPWLAQRGSAKADAEAIPLRGALGDAVNEIASAAPDLVAYGAKDEYSAKLLDIDEALRKDEARTTWVSGITTAGQVLASGAAVIGALLIGASQVQAGTMMPSVIDWIRNIAFIGKTPPPLWQMEGTLLAVLVLTPLALHEALSTLIASAQTHTRAKAALARVEAILDAEPVGRGDLPASTDSVDKPGVSLMSLDAGWPGNEPVVRDLNLELTRGEIVGLVGPSGVGKTTVAATILGLIPAMAGQVEVRGRVGYLPQDAHIFSTSIAENVKIGNRDATEEEVRHALDRAGLHHLSPDRIVGETGTQLSGGEARRLALARLMVGQFPVLILDEPTEHLDLLTATALMDDIWANTGEAAVLVITHDPNVIARCDRVVELAVDPALV